jgi:glycosyltransferase involved in cell wall biosynthesis
MQLEDSLSAPASDVFRSSLGVTRQKVFIDATGVLSTFGSPPTGIPRVERFLIDAALSDPDCRVVGVRFDRQRGRFRGLNAFERKHLLSDPDQACCEFRDSGAITIVARAFQIIRQNPAIGRDADRHFGNLAAGCRQGIVYSAFKTLFRLYRIYRGLVSAPRLFWTNRQAHNIDADDGIILLSNPAVLGSFLRSVVKTTKRTAVICHDLIPMVRPDLTVDAAHARRFSTNLVQVLGSKPIVFCPSQATISVVGAVLRNVAPTSLRVTRFHMPSVLYERAQRTHGLSKIKTTEPFVFYCSTIEARKNHLLLAQVWQRALDEGVVLPKLVCAGKWGWGVGELVDYLAERPALLSFINFTGPVSDDQLIDYYRRALFGVVPSHIEGYCASECLDFGVPGIVSTAPALKEATGGIMPIVDPADYDGWYREIRRMANDENYRMTLSREIVAKHRPTPSAASWATIKEALLDCTTVKTRAA